MNTSYVRKSEKERNRESEMREAANKIDGKNEQKSVKKERFWKKYRLSLRLKRIGVSITLFFNAVRCLALCTVEIKSEDKKFDKKKYIFKTRLCAVDKACV